mmetsp:Transcript_30748/g.98327  ORF Transcript_30748/g.98327 Transcript_30748/m.98327 type:complete len:206 (+) Transcript_30748:215-832(+)
MHLLRLVHPPCRSRNMRARPLQAAAAARKPGGVPLCGVGSAAAVAPVPAAGPRHCGRERLPVKLDSARRASGPHTVGGSTSSTSDSASASSYMVDIVKSSSSTESVALMLRCLADPRIALVRSDVSSSAARSQASLPLRSQASLLGLEASAGMHIADSIGASFCGTSSATAFLSPVSWVRSETPSPEVVCARSDTSDCRLIRLVL